MTAIAMQLGSRTLPVTSGTDAQCGLHTLRKGAAARIVGYSAEVDASTARRLFDLGFTPGAVVEVVRRAPVLDPVIYRVAGCELALRRRLAQGIQVESITQ